MIEIYIPNETGGLYFVINKFKEATPAQHIFYHVGTQLDGTKNIDRPTVIELDDGRTLTLNPVTKRKTLFFIHPGYNHG